MTDYNIYITEESIDPETDEGLLSDYSVAVKDNISTSGIRTTCGSEMLSNYVPPYNATVVDDILEEGGTVTGKTNMDEFGMGTTTETSNFGPTRNPLNEELVPGGSSGGSAVAVATDEADVALGSDTGGSIRCPAAFCNIYGLKPTYGLVSRYGLIAYGNSLEQIGPMADNVDDLARLLNVISGSDQDDMTTQATDTDYQDLDGEIGDVKVAVPSELISGIESDVESIFRGKMEDVSDWVEFEEVDIKYLDLAVEAYYIIAMSEAASNLSRFDGLRYGLGYEEDKEWSNQAEDVRGRGFGDEVKRRIMLGTYITSEGYHDKYYLKAQKIRSYIKSEFDRLFDEYDFVCSPTMPVKPMKIGESLDDPVKMYKADANTTPINLADVPAISVPIEDKPVGMQVVGSAFSERKLMRFADRL